MRYWITTQWPARKGEKMISRDWAVWLPDGREQAAEGMKPGDRVFIYKSKTGRGLVEKHADGQTTIRHCQLGPEAIIAVGEVTGPVVAQDGVEPEQYINHTEIWWRWAAPVRVLSSSGFVPRQSMNQVIGYKSTYNLRGFGKLKSGLKEISKEEAYQLLTIFRSGTKPLPAYSTKRGHSTEGGGEGPEHKALKEFVAKKPAVALGEDGLVTERVEFPFPTGDRADIVLRDISGRIIGVEIEVDVLDGQTEGLLQAIKYRRMLELVDQCNPGDSRSMLVAYSISKKMKATAKKYGIECFEISRRNL